MILTQNLPTCAFLPGFELPNRDLHLSIQSLLMSEVFFLNKLKMARRSCRSIVVLEQALSGSSKSESYLK